MIMNEHPNPTFLLKRIYLKDNDDDGDVGLHRGHENDDNTSLQT